MKPNIAIDGPAGAGKSTIAKEIARRLGFLYIDTGAMYRALTYLSLKEGVDLDCPKELTRLAAKAKISLEGRVDEGIKVYSNGEDVTTKIRQPHVSKYVSKVARVEGVRTEMIKLQREIASSGGVVMDGRDIGSVVIPEAEVKFFVTASLEERTSRRLKELKEKGYNVRYEELKKEIVRRDMIDTRRKIAPLKQADDAILIDTTKLSVEETVKRMLKIFRERTLKK